MQRVYAIVHLSTAGSPVAPRMPRLILGGLRGVYDVAFDPEESVVRVLLDPDVAGLPDVVRTLEEAGLEPASVALRGNWLPLSPRGEPRVHRRPSRIGARRFAVRSHNPRLIADS